MSKYKGKLTDEQRTYVVMRLATYDKPFEVLQGLKEKFGVTIVFQTVEHYHPERAASRHLAQRWKDLFWATRKAYLTNNADIGAMHKLVRIRWRENMMHEAWNACQFRIANDILDSIAKETGGGCANQRGNIRRNHGDMNP